MYTFINYLGSIAFYKQFAQADCLVLEQFEHYTKQTFRNRCIIAAANGPLVLSIPLVQGAGSGHLIRDLRIDYRIAWQRQHWRSLESAYRNSPFFQYYAPDFEPFYTSSHSFLFDYNLELMQLLADLLRIDTPIVLSDSYLPNTPGFGQYVDARELVVNKHYRASSLEEYPQVFAAKYGFVSSVSAIDLLFNLGPDAAAWLHTEGGRE